MMHKGFFILILLLSGLLAQAQELYSQQWREYVELLSDDGDDELVEDLLELFDMYHESPANINDTNWLLRDFPFISDWQRKCLHSYIIDFGPLMTLEELYVINGFDSLTVGLLRPLTACFPISHQEPITLKKLLTNGHSNLVAGIGGTIEKARGYTDSIYEGDNLRVMWRYYYKYKDKIQLQLSGDKDPGEALFAGSQRQGFDFYGYSLLLNDIGRNNNISKKIYFKRIVLGQYHLHWGQGLTMWSGFGSIYGIGTSICRYGQGARPSGAFTEYGYLQGAANTLAWGNHWELTLFYSNIRRDATLPRNAATDSTIDWVQSIYNSGYHRTQTEIRKKDQLGEQLAGGRIQYQNSHWKIGVTGVGTWLDKEIIPASYVYNDNYFRGDRNCNLGTDFAYRKGNLLLFGEGALSLNRGGDNGVVNISPAAIIGTEWHVSHRHQLSGQIHYYSPWYHNLHANAVGMNSTPMNEVGGALYYKVLLPWNLTATASAAYAYFPHMKYQVYGASQGQECRIDIGRESARVRGLSMRMRYRYKSKERNITPATEIDGAYLLEQTYRHQVQCDVEYARGAWRWTSRVSYAHHHGSITEGNKGFMVFQDVRYQPEALPVAIAARIAWFDVDDYEARLYSVESDFAYQYSSIIFQNEGFRGYLVARYEINKNWNIGLKYGITLYSDKDTFGSNYELINANHRQQWRIQMRIKW